MEVWYMVPVRGGSRDVLRKNMRNLGGKPLVSYVLESILKISSAGKCVVVTDDPELADIASGCGVNIMTEPETTGKATLDDVAVKTIPFLYSLGAKDSDIFITVQATCPFIKPETIMDAVSIIKKTGGSVITGVDDRHLAWKKGKGGRFVPDYKKRVNRQDMEPRYRESGAVIGAPIGRIRKEETRIVKPVSILPAGVIEGLDIDNYTDWYAAEYIVKRKKIFIKADSSIKTGMGHLYRSSALAYELSEHDIIIVSDISGEKKLSAMFFKDMPHRFKGIKNGREFIKLAEKEKPHLIILDQLDTKASYVKALKKTGAKVITFEDMGKGAEYADLVVSDLYRNPRVPGTRQLSGIENGILNPSFTWAEPVKKISKKVNNILVLFGGTDPSNLTVKTLRALKKAEYKGFVRVVQGMGRKNRKINLESYGLMGEVLTNVKYMPGIMKKADIAISSAGRTITELMTLGIPVICMCQNKKETRHSHAKPAYGVINLGMGTKISENYLAKNIRALIDKNDLRKKMNEKALKKTKSVSNYKTIKKIAEKINLNL